MDKRTPVRWFLYAFFATVMAISASTTFGFFMQNFPRLVPEGLVAPLTAQALAGAMGVVLLDAATVAWLWAFLANADTGAQRWLAVIMTALTFIGSATSSVAYLGLNAEGYMALSDTTRTTMGAVALLIVVCAVILNFGSAIAYQASSRSSREAIREGQRDATLWDAEYVEQQYLDQQVARKMKRNLRALADSLAEEKATELAARFYDVEATRKSYQALQDGEGGHKPTAPSAKGAHTHYERDTDVTALAPSLNGADPKEKAP